MKVVNSIALLLMIIGGVNWGLVGLFQFDLVAALFGGSVGPRSGLSSIVYILVGVASLYGIYLFRPLGIGSERDDVSSIRDLRR